MTQSTALFLICPNANGSTRCAGVSCNLCQNATLTTSALEQNFVVESQSQLGHPRQVDSHFDAAHNLRSVEKQPILRTDAALTPEPSGFNPPIRAIKYCEKTDRVPLAYSP